jgi:N4-gp56 family major capsid protein
VAETTVTTAASWIPELVSKRVLRAALVRSFWSRLSSEQAGSAIVRYLDLLPEGDIVGIPTSEPLTGAGVTEESVLLGAEEAMSLGVVKVSPVLHRHAVSWNKLVAGRSAPAIQSEAAAALAAWVSALIDQKTFDSLAATVLPAPLAGETYNAPNTYAVGTGSGGTFDSAVAANTMSLAALREIRSLMEEQGAAPLVICNQEVFGIVCHPRVCRDLLADTAYVSAVQGAGPRDSSNPIFSAVVGIAAGMAVFSSKRVPHSVNASGTPVDTAKNFAFGQDAGVMAIGSDLQVIGSSTDYGFTVGTGVEIAFGARRAREEASRQVFSAAVSS